MKKITTLLLASCVAFATQAQISARTLSVLGCVSFENNKQTTEIPGSPTQETRNFNTEADVAVLYMLTGGLGILAAITNDFAASIDNGDKQNSQSLVGGRIGARYYIPCMAPRFYTFAMATAGIASGKYKTFSGNQTIIDNVFRTNLALTLGLAYFITPYLAMEMQIGLVNWALTSTRNPDIEDYRQLQSAFAFFLAAKALTIGLTYTFGRSGQKFQPS